MSSKFFSKYPVRGIFFLFFYSLHSFSFFFSGTRSLKILSVIFRKGSHFPEREFLESEDYFLTNLKYVQIFRALERSFIIFSKLLPREIPNSDNVVVSNFEKHEHEIDKCS